MISTGISRASAAFLLLIGLTLLFASDVVLPRLSPTFPPSAAWLGQLVAAAWLALAALNWLNRAALLGGIYGRPVVLSNIACYFITAMVLLAAVTRHAAPATLWFLLIPCALFASIYGWLLLRGPIERDMEVQRRAQ